MELSQPSDESKVLMLYTGGTIGMLVGQQGYVPEPYFLTETLRSQHRFHDPHEESLFSHSSSVEGFREWSHQSGRSSPSHRSTGSSPVSPEFPVQHAHHQLHTLPVKSSRPIGQFGLSADRNAPTGNHVSCTKISENVYEAQLPTLVTPRTSANASNSKRIRYAILEVFLPVICAAFAQQI